MSVSPSAPSPLDRAAAYPQLRYMGSKRRLVPWIYEALRDLPFETAADPFVGGGCVAYLMKAMGKSVAASDFLEFPAVLARATLSDAGRLDDDALARLLAPRPDGPRFIERTFEGIFFTPDDLRFLDRVRGNIDDLDGETPRALALAALIRSCLKKQPRGVFTVSGDLSRYDDGRRDLRLSLEEHFREQVGVFNAVTFVGERPCSASQADAFEVDPTGLDLVYLDPPYVPRSDDNCYIKRYHFLEGLACYWRGVRIREDTRVKKIEKRPTPFGGRRTALDAFDRLFDRFRESIIVLSYGSNGYPDLATLEGMLRRFKPSVTTLIRPHRYHFGTHHTVARAVADEYLLIGR